MGELVEDDDDDDDDGYYSNFTPSCSESGFPSLSLFLFLFLFLFVSLLTFNDRCQATTPKRQVVKLAMSTVVFSIN